MKALLILLSVIISLQVSAQRYRDEHRGGYRNSHRSYRNGHGGYRGGHRGGYSRGHHRGHRRGHHRFPRPFPPVVVPIPPVPVYFPLIVPVTNYGSYAYARVFNRYDRPIICSGFIYGVTHSGYRGSASLNNQYLLPGQFAELSVYPHNQWDFVRAYSDIRCYYSRW